MPLFVSDDVCARAGVDLFGTEPEATFWIVIRWEEDNYKSPERSVS